jgi:Helix-hairpin-helix domain
MFGRGLRLDGIGAYFANPANEARSCYESRDRSRPLFGGRPTDRVLSVAEGERDLPRDIGAPATRALIGAGYTSLDQLAGASAKELTALHGFGPKALRIVREALEKRGQSLS